MDIFLNVIIQYVAEVIGLILVSLIGILGAMLLNKLKQNKKLQNITIVTKQVIYAAQSTVRRLQQTLVDDYKAAAIDGKLTPEQILELKQKTLEITLEQLGQPILDLLASAKIDVEAMITNEAEAFINQLKSGN